MALSSNTVRRTSVYAGFEYEINLLPGETWRLRYVNALADTLAGGARGLRRRASPF